MMFRLTTLVALAAFVAGVAADSNSTAAIEEDTGLKRGQVCEMDSECSGNLDCQRTGTFEKRCLPISCAKGAGWAMLDYGFNPDGFVNDVLEKADLNGRSQWRRFSDEEREKLMAAVRDTPAPMDVFRANYSACVDPHMSDERRLQFELPTDDRTLYGVQWSSAALFAYFGKFTSDDVNLGGVTFAYELLQNCAGVIAGGDIGVDFLAQIFENRNDDDRQISESIDFEMDYIHIATTGPLGIQVGWKTSDGPQNNIVTEVTIGASFGAALLGWTRCFARATGTIS